MKGVLLDFGGLKGSGMVNMKSLLLLLILITTGLWTRQVSGDLD